MTFWGKLDEVSLSLRIESKTGRDAVVPCLGKVARTSQPKALEWGQVSHSGGIGGRRRKNSESQDFQTSSIPPQPKTYYINIVLILIHINIVLTLILLILIIFVYSLQTYPPQCPAPVFFLKFFLIYVIFGCSWTFF